MSMLLNQTPTDLEDIERPLELLWLPIEIIFCILAFLGNKCRISATFVCKLFSTIILNHLGYFEVTVKSREELLTLNGSPLLKNTKVVIDISTLTDDDFKSISGVHHLETSDCVSPTDTMLEHISGVHHLELRIRKRGCKLTRFGFKSLHGIHTLIVSCAHLKDEWIQELEGIHTIDISHTSITDKGLAALSGVHTINLSECYNISDKGVIAISGSVHKILLNHCYITDKSVRALTNARAISLASTNITDEGLKYLLTQNRVTNIINKINLDCIQISNNVLKLLAGIPCVEIRYSQLNSNTLSCLVGIQHITLRACNVSNDAIKQLAGVKMIDICCIACVDDSTLKALAGVHTIFLDSTSVTDKGLGYLVGVKVISLCECKLITDKGVNSLIGVKEIDLGDCSQITNDGVVNLTSLDFLYFYGTQITQRMVYKLGCNTSYSHQLWPKF